MSRYQQSFQPFGRPKHNGLVHPSIRGIEDRYSEQRVEFSTTTKNINAFIAGSATSIDPSSQLTKQLDAYSASVWVHACVSVIAKELAAIPMVATVMARDGTITDQPDTDQQAAIDNSSERLEVTDYIEIALLHLNLAGSAPIVAMRRNGDLEDPRGPIDWFRPLRPSRVRVEPGKDEFISRFVYSVSGEEVPIHPDNVAFLRFPDPNDDYWGESPLTVLSRKVNTEIITNQYNETLLRRGGRPNGIYESHELEDRTKRRLEWELDRKIGDYERTGKAVILPDGVKPTNADFAPKDMMWMELAQTVKNCVLAIYGVPPLKVMDLKDASKLANAGEQRKEFREATLFHLGRKLTRSLERVIKLTWGPQWGVRLKWEEAGEQIDPVERRIQSRADFQAGLVTRNEARLSGDEYGEAEDPNLGSEYSASGSPLGAVGLSFGGGRRAAPFTAEHKRFASALAETQRRLVIPPLSQAVRKAFTEQKSRVLANLKAVDPSAIGKAFQVKALPMDEQRLLDQLFDTRKEGEEFRKIVGPVFLREMVATGSSHLRKILPAAVIAGLRNSTQRYEDVFNSVMGQKIQQIQSTTRGKIVDTLRQAFERGFDPQQLGGTLAELFNRWGVEPLGPGSKTVQQRADLIAQTETTTLFNGAAHAANLSVLDSGGRIVKGWSSLLDGFEREDHQEMDRRYSASPIPVDEPFVTQGGAKLMYPGDPSGPVEQVARCRCTQIEQVLAMPTV